MCLRRIEPIPAATFRPVEPSMLSGCIGMGGDGKACRGNHGAQYQMECFHGFTPLENDGRAEMRDPADCQAAPNLQTPVSRFPRKRNSCFKRSICSPFGRRRELEQ